MKTENILGFNICNTNYDELINNIFTDFNNNIRNFIVNINPEIIVHLPMFFNSSLVIFFILCVRHNNNSFLWPVYKYIPHRIIPNPKINIKMDKPFILSPQLL